MKVDAGQGSNSKEQQMKAVVCPRYGSPEVLRLEEMPKPFPANNEILVRVRAATVTRYDCWQRSCTAPTGFGLMARLSSGVRRPKRPVFGTDLSGDIEAIGKDVSGFKVSDQVFGYTGMNLGAHAQYVCLPEQAAAIKPANVMYEEAATVLQGGLTALFFLRKGNIRAGQKVLVFGASGGVGIFAVQLAKYFGAGVTGVCSGAKMELVKSLGADRVIDYATEDFSKSGDIFDIVLDTIGKSPVSESSRSLKDGGYYLLTTFGLPKLIRLLWFSTTSGKKIYIGALKERKEDLVFLKELLESGKLRAVIDRVYPLEQAVEAHRYVETGAKTGSVVLKIEK
jgi:NADPH:quinone reductase-like Zn-dependent oxidoreductase